MEPTAEKLPAVQADALETLIGTVQAPSDWAAEHDHYLYGTSSEADREP